jgi:hypothetical protein
MQQWLAQHNDHHTRQQLLLQSSSAKALTHNQLQQGQVLGDERRQHRPKQQQRLRLHGLLPKSFRGLAAHPKSSHSSLRHVVPPAESADAAARCLRFSDLTTGNAKHLATGNKAPMRGHLHSSGESEAAGSLKQDAEVQVCEGDFVERSEGCEAAAHRNEDGREEEEDAMQRHSARLGTASSALENLEYILEVSRSFFIFCNMCLSAHAKRAVQIAQLLQVG